MPERFVSRCTGSTYAIIYFLGRSGPDAQYSIRFSYKISPSASPGMLVCLVTPLNINYFIHRLEKWHQFGGPLDLDPSSYHLMPILYLLYLFYNLCLLVHGYGCINHPKQARRYLSSLPSPEAPTLKSSSRMVRWPIM
jgi:hypothetical protein